VVVVMAPPGIELLPIGPFRRWLLGRLDPAHACADPACNGLHVLADRLGVTERNLRRWLRECGYIRADAVDAAACALGDHIDEIYSGRDEIAAFGPVCKRPCCRECGEPMIKPAPRCGFCAEVGP
jgi:hypothetical protein